MKKRIVMIALTCGLPTAALAMPQSFTVTSVMVERDGQWRADPNGHQTPAQCSHFRVSPAAARRWFANAKEVSQHEWLEQLDWTQCSARGTLRTADHRTYRWELDQSGRARVRISSAVSVYLAGHEIAFTDLR